MKRVCFAMLLLALGMKNSEAQEVAVPVELQLRLFSKILTYDRNVETRLKHDIVFGVVYQSNYRKSLLVKDEIMILLRKPDLVELKHTAVRCVALDLDEIELSKGIAKDEIDLLYVAPLRGRGIDSISRVSQANGIMTLTGVPEYVESGIAVGLDLKDGRPRILVNLNSAKTEGADFSSELLNLAKVIK